MNQLCAGPEETRRLAAGFAASLQAGDVIALHGDLGAGKTEFVKGLVEGLGSNDAVTSPTFTLVHEYHGGRLPVYHFDFYRLDGAADLDLIGYDECLGEPGVTVIEWAGRFPARLPAVTRHIRLIVRSEHEREVNW
ncbi:MAG TPA: tRNA (adenosine(37)-N6)-threonylcarbamoyltransferase complex ATPase subunit type 1 TsaE [Chthoniobacterales bacterium]